MKQTKAAVRSVSFPSTSRARYAYDHALQVMQFYTRNNANGVVKLAGNVLTVPYWFPVSLS
jgi:hypothetical protein